MINGWYRDMDKIAEYYAARRDPGAKDRRVRVRETSPGVWEPDDHGTHEIWSSMLPSHAAPEPGDPGGPHEIPGMPPCICSACVTRRAREKTAAGAIEQARQDAKAAGHRVEMAQFLRGAIESGALDRRDPLVLDYLRSFFQASPGHMEVTRADPPVYGVTGPAVSAGGLAGVVCVKDEFTRCGCPDCIADPAPPPEPEDEAAVMWRTFWEPVFLDPAELDRLAPYGGPGTCSGCHLPAMPGKPACWYCTTLHDLETGTSREPLRAAPPPVLLAGRREHPVASPAGAARADRKMRSAGKTRLDAGLVLGLVLGIAVIYSVMLSGLPHILAVIGIAMIFRAIRQARP